MNINFDVRRERKAKKILRDCVKNDKDVKGVNDSMLVDRRKCVKKKKTCCADPK